MQELYAGKIYIQFHININILLFLSLQNSFEQKHRRSSLYLKRIFGIFSAFRLKIINFLVYFV